jgi:hypothetical protein
LNLTMWPVGFGVFVAAYSAVDWHAATMRSALWLWLPVCSPTTLSLARLIRRFS